MAPETYLLKGEALDGSLENICYIAIESLPVVLESVPMVLLGDVFIRNFYSVFDIESQVVQLGVKKGKENIVKITVDASSSS